MGSLGCLVTKRGDDAWYLLSACHVLARAGDARYGDTIVEPARPDDNAAPLAILTDFEPLRADGTANLFDAAIARLNQKTDVKAQLPLIGVPKLSPMDPVLYRSVRKYGAGTGLTIGVITDAHADVTLELGTGCICSPTSSKLSAQGVSFPPAAIPGRLSSTRSPAGRSDSSSAARGTARS